MNKETNADQKYKYIEDDNAASSYLIPQSFFLDSMFLAPRYYETSAWIEHIPFAFWIVEAHAPTFFVELGTHYGVSYFSFCQAIERLGLDSRCYAVDTWKGDRHAGFYAEAVFEKVTQHNNTFYSSFSSLVKSTFDEAVKYFDDGTIDLLHIDGQHNIESVTNDFNNWLPKLSNRALVLFHDSNVREREFGVYKLVDSLKERYPFFEFSHGHGLTLFMIGTGYSEHINNLVAFEKHRHAKKNVQHIFARLGKSCADACELIKKNNLLKRADELISNSANELSEAKKTLSAMEKKLELKNTELSQARRTTKQTIINKGQLRQRIQLLEHINDQQKNIILTLNETAEKWGMDNQIANLASHIDEMFTKTHEEILSISLDKSLLVKKENEILTLSHQLREATSKIEDLEHDLKNLVDKKIDDMKQQIDKKNQLLNSYFSSLEKADNELASMRNAMASLQRDNAKLEIEHASLTQEINHLHDRSHRFHGHLMMSDDRFYRINKIAFSQSRFRQLDKKKIYFCSKDISNNTIKAIIKQSRKVYPNELETIKTFFDFDWYKRQIDEELSEKEDLLNHYISKGIFALLDPHPYFDSDYYVANNDDVLLDGINPICHYLTKGYKLQKDPHPLFSSSYYTNTNIDVVNAGIPPLLHYIQHGAAELRNPNILFDANWYAQQYAENIPTGMDPLYHYIVEGSSSGYSTHPIFNATEYLAIFPEAGVSRFTTLGHYLLYGMPCGVNPSSKFNFDYYYNANPDVANSKMNALEHYILFGKDEGRKSIF